MIRSIYSSGTDRMSETLAASSAARLTPGRGAWCNSIGANMEKGI
jgi:hypothetical protein